MPSKILLSTATLLLSIAISKTSAKFQDCPDPAAILPCKCSRYAIVTCVDVKNFTDIKVILSGQMYKPFSLKVVFKGKAKLEKGLLDDVKAQRLSLVGTDVEFADDAFTDMKNYLRELQLSFYHLESVPGAAISKLNKLDKLTIKGSVTLNISISDTALLPESIKHMNIMSNGIYHIDPNAFVGLSQLLTFELFNCHLYCHLPKSILPFESIKTVAMSQSRLTEIPMGNFERVKNAKINLGGNKISTLPKESVLKSFLDRGNSMALRGNHIKCGCDLKWIPRYKKEHFGRINLHGTCYEGQTPVGDIQELNATSFKDC